MPLLITAVHNMHHSVPHHNTLKDRLRSRRLHLCSLLLALGFFSSSVTALEIKGKTLADQVQVGGQTLLLNGAGLRSKFFVSVYVGGLYLAVKSSDVKEILAMPGPKRIAMYFIYDEISESKIRGAWLEGFRDNNSDEVMEQMQSKIEAFNSFWPTIKSGDIALVDYLPGKGTQISLNGEVRGIIPGENFHKAVLRIWLGDDPVDSDLKAGMLGAE